MHSTTRDELSSAGVDYPYLEVGRDARQDQAVSRWALMRSAERFLQSERWRRNAERERAAMEADQGKIAHLDTRRAARPLAPAADWYLDGAPEAAEESR